MQKRCHCLERPRVLYVVIMVFNTVIRGIEWRAPRMIGSEILGNFLVKEAMWI